jgi:hypothetical protein
MLEGIRMTTSELNKCSQLKFFLRNLEVNFIFNPRHWGFALTCNKNGSWKYSYTIFRFRFLFIHIFSMIKLVRKPAAQVHSSL